MDTFQLPPKVYNFIKYLVLIFMPGFTTLYIGLANAWNWDHITNVSTSLTAITAFLGTLVGVSSRNYKNDDNRYFGEIHVTGTDEGAEISHQVFNEDPTGKTIADKQEVTFKVVHS